MGKAHAAFSFSCNFSSISNASPFAFAFALALVLSACQDSSTAADESHGAVAVDTIASTDFSLPWSDGTGDYCFEGRHDRITSPHDQRRIRATDTLANGRYSVRAWDTLVAWNDARFVPLPTDPVTATVITGDSAITDILYWYPLQPLFESVFPLFEGEAPTRVRFLSSVSSTGSGIAVVTDSIGLVFASSSWSSRIGSGSKSYYRRSWHGHEVDVEALRARVDSLDKSTGIGAEGGWGAVDMCTP